MAILISNTERIARIRNIERMLRALRYSAREIERLERNMKLENQDPATIHTSITNLLDDWNTMRTQIGTELAAISSSHQVVISPGTPASLTEIWFEPAMNNGLSVIQPKTPSTSWNTLFDPDDIVLVSNAEDQDNNRTWKVVLAPGGGYNGVNYIPSSSANFDSATGWSGANWTISGGKATHVPGDTEPLSFSRLYMTYTPGAESVFLVSFKVLTHTAGTLTVDLGGMTATYSLNITEPGGASTDYVAILDYTGVGDALSFTPSTDFDGAIDTVSMLPILGLVVEGIPYGTQVTRNYADSRAIITLEEDN